MSAAKSVATLFALVDLEADDNLLIVSDTGSDERVADLIYRAALERGADVTWAKVRARIRNGDELPRPVRAAANEADVLVTCTSWSPSHSAGVIEAMRRGVRVVGMPGIRFELIEDGAATADYDEVKALTDRFGEHLARGKSITVTTPLGTEFEAELGGWKRVPLLDGGPLPRGAGGLGNFPSGEAAISPIEGTTNGRIVVDLTTSTTRTPLAEHVVLTVADGLVTAIEGGEEADALRSFLAAVGPSAHVVAEIALGTNDRALHVGLVLEDEKKLGTVHVGLGNARAFGGLNDSPVHVDVIFDRATVTVDGVELLVDGAVAGAGQRRESLSEIEPWEGRARRSKRPLELRDGRLYVGWDDARGVCIWSQVGDDESARLAASALGGALATDGDLPTDLDGRLVGLLHRYGVVRQEDASDGSGGTGGAAP